ncbi:MAG: hypothetical protein MUC62_08270 [Candidatus Thermoplasmatota archaeon]|jgi:hypothetical protein|nr:hypothetical protein [Candidatus Thermoplasmatota archaeon]
MTENEVDAGKALLEEALWQIEEAKKADLSASKAMNFINLSKEASGYGNIKLSMGLLKKARETLFNDIVEKHRKEAEVLTDVLVKLRMQRSIKDSVERFQKGDLKGAYDLLMQKGQPGAEAQQERMTVDPGQNMQTYAEAIEVLQRSWLRMKQEEGKGKDMGRPQAMIKDAKAALASKEYGKVISICQEMTTIVLSPHDRLREETEETIDEIARTMKALFPGEARSPKERFFKKQIEDLISNARDNLLRDRPVEAINASRKAKDILQRMEQESIKDDIPKMMMELKTVIDELRSMEVDVSYEDYLLKQVEETFWKSEYIKARKIANKLESITRNAREHQRMAQLNDRLGGLNRLLKENAGRDGYTEAREFIQKAVSLMEQSAFDMANSLLDKAQEALKA